MWQVLVVEDDNAMLEFFASSVRNCPELQLAAAVGSVTQAKDWLDQDLPLDVLLTDLGLPDGSGLEVIRYTLQKHPRCEPLVISVFGDEVNVLASIEAGALGYIQKDTTPEDVAKTILQMLDGESPISPMIARRVLMKYRTDAESQRPTQNLASDAGQKLPTGKTLLSPREQEVLTLVARGFTHAEIANLQGLSIHTIQSHIKNLYAKLAVHNKTEAVYEATRHGFLMEKL